MMAHIPTLDSLRRKKRVFDGFLKEFTENLEAPGDLQKAARYALTSGGKRLRPVITLLFGDATPCLLRAALSLELFHTASLIADDLPAMDNDTLRRELPAVHVAYGETTALLTSYGLICGAFREINEAASLYNGEDCLDRLRAGVSLASELAGFMGATGGQYLDLHAELSSREGVEEVFYRKTVTLFEVAFCFGWIFSGRPLENLDMVRKMAYHYGLCFQIADDWEDRDAGDAVNVFSLLSKEEAFKWFYEELHCFDAILEALNLNESGFQELRDIALARFER